MRVRITILASVLCAFGWLNAFADDFLRDGFENPPREARPLTWWHWINGNVTKEGIEKDLEDMKRVGIGGVQLLDVSIYLPPGPVGYGSDLWHEHVQHAMRTADKLGLEFYLMNCPGWSASGGPWNKPEGSMKQFVWSETAVKGGKVQISLPAPRSRLEFYRDVAAIAVPARAKTTATPAQLNSVPEITSLTPFKLGPEEEAISRSKVLVLSRSLSTNGLLTAELPPGEWTILRFGFTSTGRKNHPAVPEGHGLECDKMDSSAVEFQFENALERIIREAGPLAGKTLRGILFDSFEAGYQNWTDAMPAKFQELRCYDLIQWLPVLTGRVVGSKEESEAFLRDFRRVIAELIAREYFGTMQRLARRHGMIVYAEAQGGPLNPFLCNRFTDVPMNEFWMPDATPRIPNLKHIASFAGQFGRTIVAAEAFTAKPEDGAWLATPASLKLPGDTAFLSGINRFVLHTYAHQPWSHAAPGFTLGRYGTHFGRLNTWWPYAGEWVSYVSRSQFLLQQGRTVADICFLSDVELGAFMPTALLKVPPGYDYEICYPDHLLGMTWTNGALRTTNGAAYRVLVLPPKWVADPATLRHLQQLANAGAQIIGPGPMGPIGLASRASWEAIAASASQFPSVPRESLAERLQSLGVEPDFSYMAATGPTNVRYIHKATKDADIYFVANQRAEPVTLQASFRIGDRVPELWDAVTGKIQEATNYETRDGRILVPLDLDTFGSIFVIFRRPLECKERMALPTPSQTLVTIEGPWEVRFQAGRGAPNKIQLQKLESWTVNPDAGVRHFSGIAHYKTHFDFPPDRLERSARVFLNVGKVCDVAEVTLNGRRVGVVWAPPMELEVTEQLQIGSNVLEVAVANRWVNRLIGDESLPPDLEYATKGSIFTIGRLMALPDWLPDPEKFAKRRRFAFATWDFYEKNSPLLPSGLLGPVRLEVELRDSR